MVALRGILCALLLTLLPMAGLAQGQQTEEPGLLEGLIEDNLSGAGRTVDVIGFAGALSSTATIDEITIADDMGVWITLRGVTLNWTRSALFRGRLEIDELSAREIVLARLPVAEDSVDLPSAEARPFSLPELPVSVDIGAFRIDRLTIEAPVIGEPATLSVSGSAALEGGNGQATLDIERQDRPGAINLVGSFANADRTLDLDLSVREPQGGLIARLANLPGAPSVALELTGQGPLSDFGADLRLDTDGERRLEGRIATRTRGEGGEAEQILALDIRGDVAPLFVPEYRPFFGPDISLVADARRLRDGSMSLDGLELTAQALSLTGEARLAPDGWPEMLNIQGRIASGVGEAVLLPIGDNLRVERVTLGIAHDSAQSGDFTIDARIAGLDHPRLRAALVSLAGDGQLTRADGLTVDGASGELAFSAIALDLVDPALSQAVGDEILASLMLDWQSGGPLTMTDLSVSGVSYGLDGDVSISATNDQTDAEIVADVLLKADDLARFGPLAQLEALAGRAAVQIAGSVLPLSGAFDVTVDGDVEALRTGIAQLDPLLEGPGVLRLAARRDTEGTLLRDLRIATDHVAITGDASVSSTSLDASLELDVDDLDRALHGLSGPVNLSLVASGAQPVWDLSLDARAPGDARLQFDGILAGDGTTQLLADGRLQGRVGQLQRYREISGQDRLSGAASFDLDGLIELRSLLGNLSGQAQLEGFTSGITQLDGVLAPQSRLDFRVTRGGDRQLNIKRLDIDGSNLSGSVTGSVGARRIDLGYDVALRDLAPVLPGVRGAAGLRGSVDGPDSGPYDVVLALTAPGGAAIDFDGTVTGDGSAQLEARGLLEGRIDNLSAWRQLAGGRALGGGVRFSLSGWTDLLNRTGVVQGGLSGAGFRSGTETVDLLLGTGPRLELNARAEPEGRYVIQTFDLNGGNLRAGVSGVIDGDAMDIAFDAAVPRVDGLAPGISGSASAAGRLSRSGGPYQLDARLTGPGGSTASANGSISQDAQRFDLDLNGRAPLELANRLLRPRILTGTADFDLRMSGPPALQSLSGTISTRGARLSLPTLQEALTGIDATVSLSGARATVAASARFPTGGRILVDGPISLVPPLPADLAITLDGLALERDKLFQSTIDGRLSLSGPLTAGPAITGRLTLGPTELGIPEGTGLSFGGLPGLEHASEPADVRLTRLRAGLISEGGGAPEAAVSLPLDITISAPQRIFVRGRGLTAELGGEVKVTGTTSEPVPQGGFSLIRGQLDLLGRRLTLDEGQVQLRGALDPEIRFAASTTVEEVSLSLLLSGELSQPELTLSSSPELPEEEILALFLFGRNVTQISPLQVVRLAAAVRTLSGKGNGISENLRQGIGVDTLDLNTTAEGTTEATVGSYLTDNIYTDVTVDSEGESEVNLNLTVRPGVTVRGRMNNQGDTGIGIFIERDY